MTTIYAENLRVSIVDESRRLHSERVIARRIYSCDTEPGEKFIRRLLKLVLILAISLPLIDRGAIVLVLRLRNSREQIAIDRLF